MVLTGADALEWFPENMIGVSSVEQAKVWRSSPLYSRTEHGWAAGCVCWRGGGRGCHCERQRTEL